MTNPQPLFRYPPGIRTGPVHPSRSQVREVPCPACNAPAGQHCTGARGKTRTSNHTERVHLRRNNQTPHPH